MDDAEEWLSEGRQRAALALATGKRAGGEIDDAQRMRNRAMQRAGELLTRDRGE
jgi:hypothetical protein